MIAQLVSIIAITVNIVLAERAANNEDWGGLVFYGLFTLVWIATLVVVSLRAQK